MLKETQLCAWTGAQPWSTPFAVQPCFSPMTEDNLSLFTLSSIMAELTYLMEEKALPLKVTARDNLLLENWHKSYPTSVLRWIRCSATRCSSLSDPEN